MINIAVLSAKGGTGKTTLAVALAHEYARCNPGYEVVLIDGDNQGNVAISLNIKTQNTLGAFLYEATPTLDVVRYKDDIPFFVVESGRMHLYEAEKKIYTKPQGIHYLGEKLLGEFPQSSMLIWDMSPSLSILNDSILAFADYIVIPTHTDYLSLTGISNLLSYLEHFKGRVKVRYQVLGIAVTLHREHVNQNKQNLLTLQKTFPKTLFRSIIPLSTAIATTAQNHQTPLETPDAKARGHYELMVQEIHQRMLISRSPNKS